MNSWAEGAILFLVGGEVEKGRGVVWLWLRLWLCLRKVVEKVKEAGETSGQSSGGVMLVVVLVVEGLRADEIILARGRALFIVAIRSRRSLDDQRLTQDQSGNNA